MLFPLSLLTFAIISKCTTLDDLIFSLKHSILQIFQYNLPSLPFITIMLPLSLYIHIPWCIRKCPYCDFNSHKSPDRLPELDYIKALVNDLKADLALINLAHCNLFLSVAVRPVSFRHQPTIYYSKN